MKHLWLKNSVNSNQNNHKNVYERGNITMTSRLTNKPKRFRSAFTTYQLNYLENEYTKYPYVGIGHRKEIASFLSISERGVKIWFQNRRMKEKKESISKELCDEETSRQQVEFAKNRLNNVITVQSGNDQSLKSLPLLTTDVDIGKSMMNNNSVNVERQRVTSNDSITSKYFQNTYPNQNKTEKKLVTFLKNRGLLKGSRPSMQNSIDLCQKYKRLNKLQSRSNHVAEKQGQSALMNHNSSNHKVSTEDLSTKKRVLQPEQRTCASHGDGISGYLPVVPNFYPQPFMSPSGVIWKPVNVMSVMTDASPTVPSNVFNVMRTQDAAPKACHCNCHLKSFPINTGVQTAPRPQYVLTAVPLHNPSTKV